MELILAALIAVLIGLAIYVILISGDWVKGILLLVVAALVYGAISIFGL